MFSFFQTIKSHAISMCATAVLALILSSECFAATFIVNRSDDRNTSTAACGANSGAIDCSLREALTASNSTFGPNTIELQVGVITLQIAQPLVISSQTSVINGQSTGLSATTTIQAIAGDLGQAQLGVASNASVTLNRLTLTGATNNVSTGGAVFVDSGATLNLSGVVLQNSRSTSGRGGGIYIRGSTAGNPPTRVTLTNSTVRGNSALVGGGVGLEGNAELTLNNTSVSDNVATVACGGIAASGILTLINGSIISGNGANGLNGGGGGLCSQFGSNVTLQNAQINNNRAKDLGGGIYNQGVTNIIGGLIQSNVANTIGGVSGGGIHNVGTLFINGAVISNNVGNRGGGLNNAGGDATLIGVTIDGNTALDTGGGIHAAVNLTLRDSTVSRNIAFASAGIALNTRNAVISNTTVSGNRVATATGDVGGMRISFGNTSLTNVTISDNTGAFGGLLISAGTTSARNTIISNNNSVPGISQVYLDAGSFASGGNNVLGSVFGFSAASSDRVGTIAAPLDAKLRPLGNYGGTTLTQPPVADSPAVDAGNNCVLVANACGDGNAGLSNDQRGFTRIGSVTNFAVDIGAVELQTAIVTNITDASPNPASNTLRSFVESPFPYDLIRFSPDSFPNANTSINLVAPLTVGRALEISGFNANSPKITGAGQSGVGSVVVRLFNVSGAGDLRLSNVSLRVGGGSPNGGLIENLGRLSLSNCELSFGQAASNGGALFSDVGTTTTIDRCTFSANRAAVGGAIFNLGALKVSRSTFAFNSATVGAAISSADAGPNSPALTSVTVTNNRATTSGGGIRYVRTFAGSSFTLQNSIVAENTAPASPDTLGDFTSLGNNLIGRFDGGIGFTSGTNADIVGSLAAPVTANLIASSATVNNGGQAFTLRPLPASRAINNGMALGFAADQRGFPRTVGGAADIGAVEFNMTPIGTLDGARRRLPNSNADIFYTQTIEAFGAGAFTFTSATLPTFLTLTTSAAAPSITS